MMSKESKESEYSDVTFNENESVLFVLASLSYAQVREWRHSDKIWPKISECLKKFTEEPQNIE